MNDFTKEELQDILACLPFSCHKELGFAIKLYAKIQSMIEDYCEHDETEQHRVTLHFCQRCMRIK